MRQKLKNGLYSCILLSLLLHVGVWTGLRWSEHFSIKKQESTVEIVVLDQSQAQKLLQIVEQNEKALNDEIPEDAKYMSAHNQRVVKETRAKDTGEFRNTSGIGGTESAQNQPPKEEESKSKLSKVAKSGLPSLADLRPKFNPSVQRNIQVDHGSGSPASQTNDFLKDKDPSLQTLLSTREFVYYTYYQRIRGQIRQFWEPSIREKVKHIFAQGRTIASEKDHITRLVILLDKDGGLVRVQVIGESGVKDLDDAAVDAFRAAEPFPNPPKGIVDADGTIKISWDFILEA